MAAAKNGRTQTASRRTAAQSKKKRPALKRSDSVGSGNGRAGGPRDPRSVPLRRQADRQAKAAREKADAKREEASGGLSGMVADRAGDWSLDGVDQSSMQRQKYFWNPLMDWWFRMEMGGWDRLPDAPALLIGVHSGAPFPWDAWTVGVQWWRRFGEERQLHGTAHDVLMAAPLIGRFFRTMGVLPAAPDSIATALAEGRDVILWPGGDVDALRSFTDRDRAVLAGRNGFVKIAIRLGVPIVPIATVGGADAMPVVFTGRRLAKLMRLDKYARLQVFPIALSLPWGLAPAALPQIPLPAKIRTEFQPPVELDHDPERAEDEDYVEEKYQEVLDSIQHGMDALARRRRFPVLG